MGKKVDSFKHSVSDVLELPKDIILDLPRITMIGNLQAHIENHKGILEYSKETVKIKSKKGYIKVEGLNMIIKTIVTEEVIITGDIHKVEFYS